MYARMQTLLGGAWLVACAAAAAVELGAAGEWRQAAPPQGIDLAARLTAERFVP